MTLIYNLTIGAVPNSEWLSLEKIDLNAVTLLITAALVSGLTLISSDLYRYIKDKISPMFNKKQNKEKESKYYLNALNEIEDLNKQYESYKEKENSRNMANSLSVLTTQTKCNDVITKIILNTQVDRFILFHTHNGNGQPNNLKPFKVSWLQYNAVNKENIQNYQNLEVDNEYAKTLIKIQQNEDKKLNIVVPQMESCLLKAIYDREEIKYSEIYFLCATNTGIIYTSLATHKDVQKYSNNDSLDITLAIQKLKRIFKEENDRVFRDTIEREENESRMKEIILKKEDLKRQIDEHDKY